MKTEYSFAIGLRKMIVSAIIFLVPVLIANFPTVANITIGAIGVGILNWLKVWYNNQ